MFLYPSHISSEAAYVDSSETSLAVETLLPVPETMHIFSSLLKHNKKGTYHKEDAEATYSAGDSNSYRDAKHHPQ